VILPVTLLLYSKWVFPLKKKKEGGDVDGRIEGGSGWVEQTPQKK